MMIWKKRAMEKHSHHNQSCSSLEEYVLLYRDGKEAFFLPERGTFLLTLDFNLTPTRKNWGSRIPR